MSTAKELHVTAAGAYEHVINALAPVFQREAGLTICLTVANAAGVIKRIEERAPADVVLTSSAGIAHLTAVGLADARTRFPIAATDDSSLTSHSTASSFAAPFASDAVSFNVASVRPRSAIA